MKNLIKNIKFNRDSLMKKYLAAYDKLIKFLIVNG